MFAFDDWCCNYFLLFLLPLYVDDVEVWNQIASVCGIYTFMYYIRVQAVKYFMNQLMNEIEYIWIYSVR